MAIGAVTVSLKLLVNGYFVKTIPWAHKRSNVWDGRVLKVKSEVFGFNGIEDVPFGMITLQGTITYPTWGKRKIIDSKVPWEKDMLVPGKV